MMANDVGVNLSLLRTHTCVHWSAKVPRSTTVHYLRPSRAVVVLLLVRDDFDLHGSINGTIYLLSETSLRRQWVYHLFNNAIYFLYCTVRRYWAWYWSSSNERVNKQLFRSGDEFLVHGVAYLITGDLLNWGWNSILRLTLQNVHNERS